MPVLGSGRPKKRAKMDFSDFLPYFSEKYYKSKVICNLHGFAQFRAQKLVWIPSFLKIICSRGYSGVPDGFINWWWQPINDVSEQERAALSALSPLSLDIPSSIYTIWDLFFQICHFPILQNVVAYRMYSRNPLLGAKRYLGTEISIPKNLYQKSDCNLPNFFILPHN